MLRLLTFTPPKPQRPANDDPVIARIVAKMKVIQEQDRGRHMLDFVENLLDKLLKRIDNDLASGGWDASS